MKLVSCIILLYSFSSAQLATPTLESKKGNMKETVLITGGAGYIGSHTAHLMAQRGYNVIILDNFIYNQNFNYTWATVVRGDFGDKNLLEKIFSEYSISAVIHFAGFIAVGESVKNPIKYYENNVIKTFHLLSSMIEHQVKMIIFSSSAAVYGMPERLPLTEDCRKQPVNPYGNTKLIIEYLLQDFAKAYDIKFVALRYFNACGAEAQNGLGEYHIPETHIIPLAIRAALEDRPFNVFGDDYETPDKTCIRDYLHVTDLAEAHLCALRYLQKGGDSDCFNLGTGHGYSVREILDMVAYVCGKKLKFNNCARREGDPSILVADPSKAKEILKWKATHSDLEKIIKDAYQYELLLSSVLKKRNEVSLIGS